LLGNASSVATPDRKLSVFSVTVTYVRAEVLVLVNILWITRQSFLRNHIFWQHKDVGIGRFVE